MSAVERITEVPKEAPVAHPNLVHAAQAGIGNWDQVSHIMRPPSEALSLGIPHLSLGAEQKPGTEIAAVLVAKTSATDGGNRTEVRTDGSQTEYDKSGRPTSMDDAKHNHFEYQYDPVRGENDKTPSYVKIVGPFTQGKTFEFRLDGSGDVFAASNDFPGAEQAITNRPYPNGVPEYKVTSDGAAQPSNLYLGGSGHDGIFSGGISEPLQNEFGLAVQPDGGLTIAEGGITSGIWPFFGPQGHWNTITLSSDATSTLYSSDSPHKPVARYDRDGHNDG